MSADAGKKSTLKRCPECGKQTVEIYKPFCSKRCADIDLHRWMKGQYAIPVVEEGTSAEIHEEAGS